MPLPEILEFTHNPTLSRLDGEQIQPFNPQRFTFHPSPNRSSLEKDERKNKLYQDRLIKELRLRGIDTATEVNKIYRSF